MRKGTRFYVFPVFSSVVGWFWWSFNYCY